MLFKQNGMKNTTDYLDKILCKTEKSRKWNEATYSVQC